MRTRDQTHLPRTSQPAWLCFPETRPRCVCEASPGVETSSTLAHAAESKWPRPRSPEGSSRWKSLKIHLSGPTLPPVDFLSSGKPCTLPGPSSVSTKPALSKDLARRPLSHAHRTALGPFGTQRCLVWGVSRAGRAAQAGQRGLQVKVSKVQPSASGHECGAGWLSERASHSGGLRDRHH